MRYLIALVLMFCTAFADNQILNVGMQLQDPPFEMLSPEGKPSGLSVELAYALGKYLGRPVSILDFPFNGLIPALQAGKIDCIISSMTVTDDRKKIIDFSEPYITTGLAILLSKQAKNVNVEDLDATGRVVVVKKGTTGELYALTNLDDATVISLEDESACVLEVVQGTADAFIYDLFSIERLSKENLKTTRANLKPFQTEQWAIGMRKGSPLKKKIDDFVKQFVSSGQMQQLIDKYNARSL